MHVDYPSSIFDITWSPEQDQESLLSTKLGVDPRHQARSDLIKPSKINLVVDL